MVNFFVYFSTKVNGHVALSATDHASSKALGAFNLPLTFKTFSNHDSTSLENTIGSKGIWELEVFSYLVLL